MRRLRKRIKVNLNAKLILSNKSYIGHIENLSEQGIKWYRYAVIKCKTSEYGIYEKISSTKTLQDFTPGTTLNLQFKIPSGEKLNLLCRVKWLHKAKANDLTNDIHIDPTPKYTALGMEIINPPPEYRRYFKTLQ